MLNDYTKFPMGAPSLLSQETQRMQPKNGKAQTEQELLSQGGRRRRTRCPECNALTLPAFEVGSPVSSHAACSSAGVL